MINKVILVGNVGVDPEIRAMESGAKMARIRLATSERYTDRATGEKREHTEWHTVTMWRGLADVVDRFVRKGSQIYVEGRLRTREYTDQSGAKRFATEVVADELKLLGRRPDAPAPASIDGTSYGAPVAGPVVGSAPAAGVPLPPVDDLPF